MGGAPLQADIVVDYTNGWMRVTFKDGDYEESKLRVENYADVRSSYQDDEPTRIDLTQVATSLIENTCPNTAIYELNWRDCNTVDLRIVSNDCPQRLLVTDTEFVRGKSIGVNLLLIYQPY